MKDRTPPRIAALLAAEDGTNSLAGVIPKLSHLLEHNRSTEVAYLCDQSAIQVSKIQPTEGQFCGYRNIQMLCLCLGATLKPTSSRRAQLREKLTIPQLQDMIEAAWDRDYNPHGRDQLGGGIKGTAKYIGSSEAEALLLSLGVPCLGRAYKGAQAWSELLDFVEGYFSAGITAKTGVHITSRPPIFLQRPKHSITVVGVERTADRERSLIAFDPSWSPPAMMRKDALACAECNGWKAKWALRQYRKSEGYLKRWSEFETVCVEHAPRVACWR